MWGPSAMHAFREFLLKYISGGKILCNIIRDVRKTEKNSSLYFLPSLLLQESFIGKGHEKTCYVSQRCSFDERGKEGIYFGRAVDFFADEYFQ